MSHILVYDATHSNVSKLPAGKAAGYTTGSSDIRWTSADWSAHPDAIRIDQDAGASDATADVLDVENRAATPPECPGWYRRALSNISTHARSGQRSPVIYCNQSTMPSVAAAFQNAGITSGPLIWLAKITSQANAEALIGTKTYGYPIIGVQFSYANPLYDVNVFDSAWFYSTPTPPPTQESLMAFVQATSDSSDGTITTFNVFETGPGTRHHIGDPKTWAAMVATGYKATSLTGDQILAQWPYVAPEPVVHNVTAALIAALPRWVTSATPPATGTVDVVALSAALAPLLTTALGGTPIKVSDVEAALRAVLHNA